jgi:hypothetical protein
MRFNVGYAQMELPFGQSLALDQCCGGFNMRRWADFGDAAFVGQFTLTVQSAIAPSGITYFPVLEDVLTQAHDLPADAMPIARDLQGAWERDAAPNFGQYTGGGRQVLGLAGEDRWRHSQPRPDARIGTALHQLERCRRPCVDLSAHRAQRSRRWLGQTLRQLARGVQRRGVSGLAGHGLGVRK